MKLLTAEFPQARLRRNRQDSWCRDLVAEHRLSSADLILPLFLREEDAPREVAAMPGIFRYTLDELVAVCQKAQNLGIRAVILFPYVRHDLKCEEGKESQNPNNLTCQATRLLKEALPDLGVMVDHALDLYTTHGHDGVLRHGLVDNDETVAILVKMALAHARAGVDVIAPSDMMDGRIGAIRKALDQEGYQNVRILAYSAKYASAFYGPFRDALGSLPALGKSDKKTYQMDPANAREALREGAQDLLEGADMLMVKPGLPYLDVIYRFKEAFPLPIFAYQVSGEYSMIKAAGLQGWIDPEKVLMESLLAFKRAGASAILTYGALEAAEILKREGLSF
ncbi:MAG: porphobilinogen synthase [Alphaproteobacteria bacterium]|nr:porphobilinogen synthase [Alphaproteobacteria bacterium]